MTFVTNQGEVVDGLGHHATGYSPSETAYPALYEGKLPSQPCEFRS